MDCLIRVGATRNSEIAGETLGEVEIITCASPAYFEASGTPRGPTISRATAW